MSKSSILVVAHKYNDILFSVDTKEFKDSSHKTLLLFKLPNWDLNDIPFIHKFDDVIIFNYTKDNTYKNIIRFFVFILKKLSRLKSSITLFSNPKLLYNKILVKLVKPNNIILVEDGLLNYVENKDRTSALKIFIQRVIGVNDQVILSNTMKTYLSIPNKATLFGGEKCQLSVSDEIESDLNIYLKKINNKKFFIGQNLYPKYCNEKTYYGLVDNLIKKHNIDFYVPHAYEFYNGQLGNISTYPIKKYTFEYLAQYSTFELYSFSSSVLLSSKLINNNIKSNLFYVDFCDSLYAKELFDICDNVYNL